MAVNATGVPAQQDQSEQLIEVVASGRELFSSRRLDVIVHLLALEELAGSGEGVEVASNDTSWMLESEGLSAADGEPSVAELAAELLAGPTLEHMVQFNLGGELVGGSTVAAAALYSGRDVTRALVSDRGPDRSQVGLAGLGFSDRRLFAVVSAWLRLDPESALLLIAHDHPGRDAAVHELQCRYDRFFSRLDHLSIADANPLDLVHPATVQVIGLKATGTNFADVVAKHEGAVVAGGQGSRALKMADLLFSPDRLPSSSRDHESVLRTQRRRRSADRLLGRVRLPRQT